MDYLHDPHPSELEDIFSSARLVGAKTTTDLLYREIHCHMNTVVVDIDTVAEINTNPSQRRRTVENTGSVLPQKTRVAANPLTRAVPPPLSWSRTAS